MAKVTELGYESQDSSLIVWFTYPGCVCLLEKHIPFMSVVSLEQHLLLLPPYLTPWRESFFRIPELCPEFPDSSMISGF